MILKKKIIMIYIRQHTGIINNNEYNNIDLWRRIQSYMHSRIIEAYRIR